MGVKRLFILALCSSLAGGLTDASAQTGAPSTERGYPVQLWQPALGPQGFFTVDSAQVPPHLSLSVSLATSYARSPFSLYTIQGPDRVETQVDVVRDLVTTELGVALGLLDKVQLGVALPFNVYQTGEDFSVTGEPSGTKLEGASLGDLRVELKYQIASFGSEGAYAVALVPGLTLPTGKDENFAGDNNVTGRLRAVVEGRWDKVRAGLTGGALFRQSRTTFAANVGHQLLYAAAVEGKIHRDVALIGEVWGRSGLSDFTKGYTDANPMEGDAGMRVALPKAFTLAVGAGLGFIRGIGAPKYRGFLALGWSPNFDDRDKDGVFDYEDRCLDTPEDIDDYKDGDGCPDLDNDGDAVLDAQDRCANTAEDLDQYQDEDGCPEADNDGDGIDDIRDPCPNAKEDGRGKKPGDGCPSSSEDADGDGVPDTTDRCNDEVEDRDGFEDSDGCPDPDNDNDSIPDTYDECPSEAEDADGVEDADGCPDNDNDKDGFLDSSDRCPGQAETLNGNRDDDGCPDPGAELVKLTETAIDLRERINFGGTPAAPTLTSGAQTLLNLVALMIKGHNEIATVTVTVNAEGAAAASTQARADAIVTFLKGKGVAADRLKAEGAGAGANKVTFPIERRAKKGTPSGPTGP